MKDRKGKKTLFLCLVVLAVFSYLWLKPQYTMAGDKYWTGSSGWWDDSINWSLTMGGAGGAGPPGDGDTGYLTVGSISSGTENIGSFGTTVFIHTGGTNTVTNFVLGRNPTGNGTYNLSDTGTLLVNYEFPGNANPYEYIGYIGVGTFNQTGGINIAMGVSLGTSSTSMGTYNLASGDLSADIEEIGRYGLGVFNHTGGTNTVTDFYLGGWSGTNDAGITGSNGTYNLGDIGILTAENEYIGQFDLGTFNQTGGTNTVTGTLTLAANPGTSGTYNLLGGTLTAASIVNNDTLAYSGGNLTANITNNGITTLSGSGTRTIVGDVTNNGIFDTTETTTQFSGIFTNDGVFISDSCLIYFGALSISENGYMYGHEEDRWYISGSLLGVITEEETVTNIIGAEGMYVYYSASLPENQYLGGLTYGLTGGGLLKPVSEHNINDILDFFEDSVDDGSLEGNGPGNSANNRLEAFRKILEKARDLINTGDIERACRKLETALIKCDGESPPPELVTGIPEVVEELNNMIFYLMEELLCE